VNAKTNYVIPYNNSINKNIASPGFQKINKISYRFYKYLSHASTKFNKLNKTYNKNFYYHFILIKE
jgi:hypothetical protein